MNHAYLERMSASEIMEYAQSIGITALPKLPADARSYIEKRRARVATVSALGINFDIPVKRAHDKRLSDLMGKPDMTDAGMEAAMRLLLGDDQFAQLVEACTDEDGTVDVNAMSVAYVRIITADKLKNF